MIARRSSPPPAAARLARAGFTLIELMIVMLLIGLMLLWLPARLDGFGDRSKLDSSANMWVAVLSGAKEMAIMDGHEVRIQVELSADAKDRSDTGRFRFVVTSRSKETPDALKTAEERSTRERRSEADDEEWVATAWRGLPQGVRFAGYSQESGQWVKANPRGEPLEISFFPDGGVRPPHAWRIASVDLADDVAHVMTIRVNALTSTPDVVEGDGPGSELPERKDASDFR